MSVWLSQRAILKMLTADEENALLRQYLARLLNTFASVNEGITLINTSVCCLIARFVVHSHDQYHCDFL